jgi:hypothetical protein
MPMAADKNQTKQHHQVEKPSSPLNTWVVKMFLNELQASVNCSLMISTVSSLGPGGSANPTGLSSCAKVQIIDNLQSSILFFKNKKEFGGCSYINNPGLRHTAQSVSAYFVLDLDIGFSSYFCMNKRDSKGAKSYSYVQLCNSGVSKLHTGRFRNNLTLFMRFFA